MALSRWIVVTSILCCYGFFKEMRPSEPFLTEYLIGPHKNMSMDDVDHQVYPVWTYSYLVALVPVFLFTDLLKYKPVIVFEAATYIGTWGLLLWAEGVLAMQIMQFMYGFATATEIAYYSYIYTAVDVQHYRTVTSMTRGFVLTGRFVAGFLGQLIISLNWASYFVLNCISMGSVCVAMVISIFLPSVKKSVYFHKETQITHSEETDPTPVVSTNSRTEYAGDPPLHPTANENNFNQDGVQYQDVEGVSNIATCDESECDTPQRNNENEEDGIQEVSAETYHQSSSQGNIFSNCCYQTFMPLLLDFKRCYSNHVLLKWSIWWAIATCGFFQVGNYIQPLWEHIFPDNKDETIYNGAVEAASTLAGAALAFMLALFKVNWSIFGELFLGIVSVGDAIMLGFMAKTNSIWLAYILYVLYKASYQMAITVTSFQIASSLKVERYALVFGCNMFVALVLQTLITVVVVDKRGFHLDIVTQFLVTAGYYMLMGLIFLGKALFSLTKLGWAQAWNMRRPMSEQYTEF